MSSIKAGLIAIVLIVVLSVVIGEITYNMSAKDSQYFLIIGGMVFGIFIGYLMGTRRGVKR